MRKNVIAFDVLVFDPFVEDEARPCSLEQAPQAELALLERLVAQIVAVELDQVERV